MAVRHLAATVLSIAVLCGYISRPEQEVSAKSSGLMNSVMMHSNGDPTTSDVLTVTEVPLLEPSDGEIRIKVYSAAVNPIDYKLVKGDIPGKKSGSRVGFDVAGVVDKIGPGCTTTLKVGDEVYADCATSQGSFAEYVNAQAGIVALKPTTLSFREAASLPLAGLTALQGVVTQGGLVKGGRIVILGGSGGVGSLAIQIAKAIGAAEVATTSSNEDFVKSLGADTVINYKTQDVTQALTGKDYDVVFDCVGGYDSWVQGKMALKPSGGVFVTIVGDNPVPGPGMVPGIINRKFWSCMGYPKYKIFLTDVNGADMATMSTMVDEGKLNPLLDDRVFSLTTESVHELMAAIMSHRTKGKLVMNVQT